jgi:hypothetical protein
MYDDATWPDTDPAACIDSVWPDRQQAMLDLLESYGTVNAAEDDSSARDQLWEEGMEFPDVMAMVAAPQVMNKLVRRGLQVVAESHFDQLLRVFESSDGELRCWAAMTIAEHGLKHSDSQAAKLFMGALNLKGTEQELQVRGFAVQAFGKLKEPGEEIVRAVTQLAKDQDEPQPLRATAIEALMEMGPSAKSAIPVLQQIKENDADSDLRMFAWAALKSVTAESHEHPCGETVAEHMRSLGRGVSERGD